ncbi:hypothetical protein AVEN_174969-1 [Araneus ventricosus]|uniref:Uncharacterized protein n=1 Tax=Araneus ventricosus TaxID=182803 RepID=A0A4Y2XAB9_ARAVE|nr:hypothetical protein AVEN_166505-1 [Araneus ventricosus]GBO46168.1 hypothetical protein AVEN_174969-1 [Araneus ventricosus]
MFTIKILQYVGWRGRRHIVVLSIWSNHCGQLLLKTKLDGELTPMLVSLTGVSINYKIFKTNRKPMLYNQVASIFASQCNMQVNRDNSKFLSRMNILRLLFAVLPVHSQRRNPYLSSISASKQRSASVHDWRAAAACVPQILAARPMECISGA